MMPEFDNAARSPSMLLDELEIPWFWGRRGGGGGDYGKVLSIACEDPC